MTLSYWQKNRKNRAGISNADFPHNVTYDIVVIGAGLLGIAVAYYLKMMGCGRLLVLEKEFIGYAASGRNAGFILSGMSEPYSRLVVGMGAQGARDLMAATLENHELIAEAVFDRNIECGYQRSGSFRLATSEVEKRELGESADLLQRDGFAAEYVGDIRGGSGQLLENYLGGLKIPVDGKLDPFA